MSEVSLIIAVGTLLFLLVSLFVAFMTMVYQNRRLQHKEEITGLMEAYQKEMLKTKLEMQEETFLFISQEIHDNVGQILSLVRLNISTLGKMESEAAEQKVTDTKELLDLAIQDLRDLSKRLNSKYVTHQPLAALIKSQLELISKTGTVRTIFKAVGKGHPLEPEKKLVIFRIVQEAFNNCIKHAEAETITVRLEYAAEKLTLVLADDGKGIDSQGQVPRNILAPGTGTYNMQYRASLIGASLRIQGSPGAGTCILLELPY